MNRQLISSAVALRFVEVRERVQHFDPRRFGDAGFYFTSVKELLRADPADLKSWLPVLGNYEWANADTDCLTALRVVSLHGDKKMRRATPPPAAEFVAQLKTNVAGRQSMFSLLADRYAWPPNFSISADAEIREYVLMRLMTAERRRVENDSSVDDELLLKLNLVAVHARAATDLRFIDALNYYYELLPATMFPQSQNAWLLVSWLALYARALASWS